MGDSDIRTLGTAVLGASNTTTILSRWHVDYVVFPTGGEAGKGCDNGIVMWIPFEESFPEANGLKVIPKSHIWYNEMIMNGTW